MVEKLKNIELYTPWHIEIMLFIMGLCIGLYKISKPEKKLTKIGYIKIK